MNIKIGTQFRHHFADGNCLWTVVEKRGRGTWIAEISADDPDYAGNQGAFTTEQIEGNIRIANFWKKSSNDSDTFFDNLKPGSIVHYSNGFKQYVRCQVTQDHQLLPIALVGEWREFDLPRRQQDGTIYLGYHAQQIKDGKTFRPHASNVWEFKGGHQKTGVVDPTNSVPLSLEVPPMTASEKVIAEKYRQLDTISELMKSDDGPFVILCRLKDYINSI